MTTAWQREFAVFAADGGSAGPSWLAPLRSAAMDRFALLGFPTPRNEDWHFTSVAPIAEREFRLAPTVGRVATVADLAPFLFGQPDWPRLVFVNGRYAPSLSNAAALPDGVAVATLGDAPGADGRFLERHLTRLAPFDQAAFTALNTAFLADGAVVRIAAGADVAPPIHLLFVSTNLDARMTHPRVLIVADRHSRATVLETYCALGDSTYFTNAVSEIYLREGATLTHVKLQRESERASHVGTVQVEQERDTHFLQFSFAVGAALSRTNVHTMLDGEGSGATLDGLYMVSGDQHVDHQTRIEHVRPNTFSREVYKGILDGRSHGVFNGKVYVHPAAQKTDGKQENNNLLLSAEARVDTKPQLEIYADDVKCTHGATVGRLDDAALFYMKSRGIGAEPARRLLTYAFAAGVLENIRLEPVRHALEALTLERFAGR